MCAQYTIKTKASVLINDYKIYLSADIVEINERILPHKIAPVLVLNKDSNLILTSMNFSLIPSWSKDPKIKFATHNARIETVTEKPTWKIPFSKQHCLVPLNAFYESVYEGPHAGNIISFHTEHSDLLFAAGIFDFWKSEVSKDSFYSFSILTREPSSFIESNGHDRSPLFLKFEDGKKWLQLLNDNPASLDFLNSRFYEPELAVEIDRPLKTGWEKRK